MAVDLGRQLTAAGSPVRVVLVFGSDQGAVERTAKHIAATVAGTPADPFRVAWLDRDDPALPMELCAASLSGGRRVVAIRGCTDRTVALLSDAADGVADVLAVAMAGRLSKQSRLRSWAEAHRNAAVVACDGASTADRRRAAVSHMAKSGISADPAALEFLMERLSPDAGEMEDQIERLALYTLPGRTVTELSVIEVFDPGAEASLMAVVDRALLGDALSAARMLTASIAGGASGVGLTRVLGADMLRLARVVAELSSGRGMGAALQCARVFPRDPRREVFATASRHWSWSSIQRALEELRRAELACKRTGANEALICGRLLESLARRSRGETSQSPRPRQGIVPV